MNLKKLLIGTDADANLGLVILRVFTGAALLTHGWGKMFGGLGGFIENVGQMGFPAPAVMGFLAAFAESFGAILLAIGLLTRPAAFLIAATMAGAALKVHAGQGFSGQEMAWLYFFPALFFLLKGAGQWSVDAILSKKTG
ncbi:MAG: DoxX family protein [Kiritimatiellae bacterium]|nr:DoxX family protein [Kiritimatiellia bacterium]NLD88908.1 DoxX family protein [Lentisphaerota bacterium]HOU21981.1 DoxX family protein [Kiritimatiellia bacterium]HPC19822.1 DoxX family protein [Kiritimatiellia bacterium]HQN80850.1 DoxX family protein [Kiritimatiellia bacterium]